MSTVKSTRTQHAFPTLRLDLGALLCITTSLVSLCLALTYLAAPIPLNALRPLYDDSHYKYLIPLLVPTTAWFVIANWVGWEYFRFA